MTVYTVLKKNSHPVDTSEEVTAYLDLAGWDVRGTVKARSAQAAVSVTAAELGEGEYVAVPARSWRPVSVKVETKTALRFS